MVINGVPEPARIGFAAHVAPHLIELGAQPTTYLQLIRTPYLHLDVLGIEVLQYCLIHWCDLRFLFFNSFRTVVGLTCNTRAVSRMPLAFIAISTICCLTSGDCPAYAYSKRNVRPRVGHVRHRYRCFPSGVVPCRTISMPWQ